MTAPTRADLESTPKKSLKRVVAQYPRFVFITFEGPEGAGKSTVIAWIAQELAAQGHAVVATREPGSGEVGASIRQILLHGDTIDAKTELFLFLADRSNHIATVVRPALEQGKVVLCDRHADSTVVYQAHARGLDPERVRALNAIATEGLVPDLTFLLDLDPEVGLGRIQSKDRIDTEPLQFHRRVREGFRAEARRDPTRWRIVDAGRSLEEVRAECLKVLLDDLEHGGQDTLPFEGLG